MTSGPNRYDVIVIGGGTNGLTAAALLAKAGRRVVLLERSERLGGLAVGRAFHPGYTSIGLHHDTVAVRADVVADLGLEGYGLALGPPPPVLAARDDGPGLLLHHDPDGARAEIAAFSAQDAERYAAYRAFLERVGGFVRRLLGSVPPEVPGAGLSGLLPLAGELVALRRLGRADMMELLRVAPMCVADWMNEWFETELLKCALAAPALDATFAGPWSPGTNALLIRAEAGGDRAARGGPRSVIEALAAAARGAGVEIRTGVEVRAIRIDGNAVSGVSGAAGESIDAPIVAASCDPKRTFLELLPPRSIGARLEHRIERLRSAGTTAKVDLALSGPLRFAHRPDLEVERARTPPTLDGMERAFDAAKYRRFASVPRLDILVPTIADPGLAPGGGHVVSILAQCAPYDLEGGWSDEQREELGDAVMAELGRYAPEAGAAVVARAVLTPVDIEERYGVTGGHPHHAEHGLDQLLTRPCPECARYRTPIAGLYLCGSGSHPGGGLTLAPGANAAEVMLGRA